MNKKFQVVIVLAFICISFCACKNKPAPHKSSEEPKQVIDIQPLQLQTEKAIEEKRLDDARQLCQKMQQIQPEHPATYYYLGNIEKAGRNYEEAADHFEKYIELTPDQAKGYNTYGMMLFDIREYALAIKQVSEAVRLDPDSIELHTNLGRIYAKNGKYEKARISFEKAKQIDPENKELNDQIKIWSDYQGYIKGLLEGVKQSPNLDLPLYGVARFYHLQGNYKQAKKYCARAYSCRESSSKLRKDIVQLLWDLGMRRHVLDHSLGQIVVKLDMSSLNTAAWIMSIDPGKLRNPSKALKYAKQASGLSKNKNPKILDTLAAAYAANDRFPEAIETVDKAIELGAWTMDKSWLKEIKKRKALYEENKPYLEKAAIIKMSK